MERTGILALLVVALMLSACQKKPFDREVALGGVLVSPDVLNHGEEVYRSYCFLCHGLQGDGRGSANVGILPPPRDFVKGSYKFTSVCNNALPVDDDLARTIGAGLRGTKMGSFQWLPDEDKRAVLVYSKTFADRWRKENPGMPIQIMPNPWGADEHRAAIDRGRLLYHGAVHCWQCHPAYLTPEEIATMVLTISKEQGTVQATIPTLRRTLERSEEIQTEYGLLAAPDFHERVLRVGTDPVAVYRTIGAGVGGTPMACTASYVAPKDLWALAHFVLAVNKFAATRPTR